MSTPWGSTTMDETFIKKFLYLSLNLSVLPEPCEKEQWEWGECQVQSQCRIYISTLRHTSQINRKHFSKFRYHRSRLDRVILDLNIPNISLMSHKPYTTNFLARKKDMIIVGLGLYTPSNFNFSLLGISGSYQLRIKIKTGII